MYTLTPHRSPPPGISHLLPGLRPHLPALTLLLVLLVLAFGAVLWWQAGREARLQRARRIRGETGERDAEALLHGAGYQVEAVQHEGRFTVEVDGEARVFRLRADLLVRRRRDGRRYIAEVKTGELAPQLSHGPTRRQLLEYALAYRPHIAGVLLVTPEIGEVRCISFPVLRGLRRPLLHPGWWFILGAGAGAAALRWLTLWSASR